MSRPSPPRRLVGGVTPRERLYRVLRAASPGTAFGVGLLLMAFHQLAWAQFCWVLIPIQLLVVRWTLKPTGQGA